MRDFTVRLSHSDIKKGLLSVLTGPNKKLVADIIIEALLTNDTQCELLAKAMYGIPYKLNYNVGDIVLVKWDNLPTWRYDKDATLKLNPVKSDRILAKIIEVNKYLSNPYQIEYDVVKGGKEEKDRTTVDERPLELFIESNSRIDETKEEVSVS